MSHIEAIFRDGVFQPLEPVHLMEDQRVRLSVEPTVPRSLTSWLTDLKKIQAVVIQRQGVFPDSAGDIAADRLR